MKIVVLDGYTLNPGDLSWDALRRLGTVEIHDRTPATQILERAAGADILLTNKTPLSAETLQQLPALRFIGVLATGYNVVDVKAARARGIPVSNIPIYGTASVAQFAFALLLELCHQVAAHSAAARAGEWTSNADWCFWRSPQIELAGKTMGIVGFGRIGREVGKIADALGMRVIAHDSNRTNPPSWQGFRFAELDELLAASDVVSLHCPLFPETQGLMNAERLAKMKKTAFLLNTSRGPLVVDQDLADALDRGVIAGAAVDVLAVEPPPATNPLLRAKNAIVTPHMAWATKEARGRLMGMAVENVAAFLNGRPQNVVNE
jgi:glycerate dehydrogenase